MTIGAKNIGTASLDAADMDDLIFKLSRVRAALADEVPHSLDPGSNPLAVQGPMRRELPFGPRLAMRSIFGILDMDG